MRYYRTDLRKPKDDARALDGKSMTSPPEKQDVQVVDVQRNRPILFLESLPRRGGGWSANKSLATRDGRFPRRQGYAGQASSGWLPKPATRWVPQMDCSLRESWSRFTLVSRRWLSFFREAASGIRLQNMSKMPLLLVLLAGAVPSFAADTIRLWPHSAPDEKAVVGAESNITKPDDELVSGKPYIRLSNVSDPSIEVCSPAAEKNTGAAIIVCPGGGYYTLAYDLEGTEVCSWLNSIGVTGVLLKYRVPIRAGQKGYEAPLQDAQRAISLVRYHADEWGIKTNRIGVLGFSAGGHLAALTGCQFNHRTYAAIDAADGMSCRPDFTMLVYPAFLTLKEHRDQIQPELTVSSNMPPVFFVQTEDDPVHVEGSLYYYLALKSVHVPAELHVFARGGHGYGLRQSGSPVSNWPKLAEQWLRTSEIITARPNRNLK